MTNYIAQISLPNGDVALIEDSEARASILTKQDALSSTQLDAANSGINSTKVGNYDTHLADTTVHVTAADKTAWNAKQDALTAGTGIDITSNVISASYPALVSYDSANRNLSFATSSNIQGDLNEVINGSGV